MTVKARSALTWGGGIAALLLVLAVVGAFVYGYATKPGWVGVADKTLWDWLQLLVVPAVLAAGGLLLNTAQRARELEDQEAQKDREQYTQEQRAQDDALQAYLDYVSKLMIDHLKVSSAEQTPTNQQPGEASAVSPTIASKEDMTEMTPDNPLVLINLRARTLAVLERLDPHRKVNVLGFLYEVGGDL
jgi:hypothetical protein